MRMRFSTTTPVAATAFNVAFMAAFKRYFDFGMSEICGIPHVELHGTRDDWQHMMEGLGVLDEVAKIDNGKGINLVAWWEQMQQVLRHFTAAYDNLEQVRASLHINADNEWRCVRAQEGTRVQRAGAYVPVTLSLGLAEFVMSSIATYGVHVPAAVSCV
jgi:hypothetical protein